MNLCKQAAYTWQNAVEVYFCLHMHYTKGITAIRRSGDSD